MTRDEWHRMIETPKMLDYGVYLAVDRLLECQKPLDTMCNGDELQFQIVHQVEELWMKLMAYTLVDVIDHLKAAETHRVVTLMGRVHRLMRLMTTQLEVLETMSPREYQEVRKQLGNGSGQESPGFQMLLRLPNDLWNAFSGTYLEGRGRTVEQIYDSAYAHDDGYVVAESLIEYDELFQKFRAMHVYLIHRSIGLGSRSLKGRPVALLEAGARHRFFPALWDVRCDMTDAWGASYGVVREAIHQKEEAL